MNSYRIAKTTIASLVVLSSLAQGKPITADSIGEARVTKGTYYTTHEGKRLQLTLHPPLQKAVKKVLHEARAIKGTVVVMRPNGEILALVGRDSKTPRKNKISLTTRVWAPAASIFKIVTTTALAASGIKATDQVCYHGGLRSITKSNLSDNVKRDNRCNDLAYGISRSQNAIMAKFVTRFLPRKRLSAMADAFGFSSHRSQRSIKYAYGSLDLPKKALPYARVAAGFWESHLSPLGAAVLTNVIASGGYHVEPFIVSETKTQKRPVVSSEVAALVAEMMTKTTTSGTARKGFRDRRGRSYFRNIEVAGKTGTLTGRNPYKQYSWFTGFAPAHQPEYVVAVLLANPQKWQLKAHTAARKVLQKAFELAP